MKRLFVFAVILLAVIALNGCGTPTAAPGDGTPTPVDPDAPVVGSIEMTATKYSVTTTGIDTSTVTVYARDANGAAMTGATINIATDVGLISAPSVVTAGATGSATFTFTSGTEKTNQVATITASAGAATKDLLITITGTTLTLTATKTSTMQVDPDPIVLTGTVRDASNNPIPLAALTLTSANLNRFSAAAPPATTSTPLTLTSDASGNILAYYTGTNLDNPDKDIVTLSGMGVQKTVAISVSNSSFAFDALLPDNVVPINDVKNLTVTWTDALGVPVAGTVYFFTNGGTLSAASVATVAGKATVTLTTSATAAPVTVQAANNANLAAATQSSQVVLDVRATTAASISLQPTPSVISPSVGALTSTSILTATVRDANNNAVAGKTVNFRLLLGPGGGEYVSPGSTTTNAAGQAISTFYSGSSTSAQNGVRIEASVDGIPTTATLTIGQQAASIIIGATNKIRKVSVNGLEVAYALPFSVLVVDNNGNPIEGAIVNLGVYPLNFYTGLGGAGQVKTGMFVNEDANRNGILDYGEDVNKNGVLDAGEDTNGNLKLDGREDGAVGEWPFGTPAVWDDGSEGNPPILDSATPGNGKLDPGGVVAIPLSVTTGAFGMAAFEITYMKSFATWIDVEISANTQNTGSQSSATRFAPLAAAAGDTPFPSSPYGL